MINIDLNFLNKELELAPIRTLFVQGENVADIIKINMPKMYNDIDLGSKVFVIKMLNRAGEYYEAVLPKNVSGESIVLEWTVTKEFTSVHGILKINVIALDDNGSVFSSKEGILEIQPAVMSSGIPITPETIFENYLSEMRMLAEASLESSETSQVILADMNSKIVNDVVTGGRDKVLSAEQGKILDGRINNIVGYAGTSTVEVVDARNAPERSTVYPTLKARLDAVDGDIVKSTYSAPTDATAPIISLPSTAVKGKLEGSIKGNTMYNAVVNGDFSNGITGWNARVVTGFTSIDGVAEFTPSAQFGAITKNTISLKAGQKVFMCARIKSSTPNVRFRLVYGNAGVNVGSITHSGSGIFETLYSVDTLPVDTSVGFPQLAITEFGTSAFSKIFVDYAMLIPITGTPYENWTADQINAMIDGYWEGLGGTSEVGVKAIGKNLFDGEWELGGYVNATGAKYSASDRIRNKKKLIKVKTSTQYKTNSAVTIWFYDSSGNFISSTISIVTNFTTPANAKFINIAKFITDLSTKLIISEGSTALPYEPYTETELFCPVELGSVPNGVSDEFTFDGKYIQRTATKTNQTGVVNYSDMATVGSFIAQLADGTVQTGVKGATLTATATKIIYQLATPIETQYPVSNLIAEAGGSVYVDSKIKISKAYGINIAVTSKIKALESVYRIKGDSRTKIENSLVTVAGDRLSLTILNASAGEIYEVVYEPYGTLLPTLSYSYPNDLAAQSAGNTKAISQIDKNFSDFMSYQNAVNVQVDFRLIAGGH